MIVFWAPVHLGLCGGEVATRLPEVAHWIGHAVTVILTGGRCESKIGDGRLPEVVPCWNFKVEGSMA